MKDGDWLQSELLLYCKNTSQNKTSLAIAVRPLVSQNFPTIVSADKRNLYIKNKWLFWIIIELN